MKIFVLLLTSLSLTFVDSAPIPSPEAKPEPCLEIIFRILQLFLTTESPRRGTTPDEDYPDPEPEPTTEPPSTDTTEDDSSGESADGPSVDADSPSTTEGNPDDNPNEIIPKTEDRIRRLRKPKQKKKENNWWFSGVKW